MMTVLYPHEYDEPRWLAGVNSTFGEHRLFARYFADHS